MTQRVDLTDIAVDLREMYQTMTLREIARNTGHAYVTIQREMHRLGISDGRKTRYDPILSDDQRSIVIGTLLGDGSMKQNGRHSCLMIDHGFSQGDYLRWKVDCLSDFFRAGWPRLRTRKNGTSYWSAWSLTLPAFDPYRMAFYRDGVKVVPVDFIGALTPLTLAVWYMDDGSLSKTGANIATMSFGEAGTKQLASLISENGIDASVSPAAEYYYLRFTLPETRKLLDLVASYIHPSMSYKLCL